MLGTSYYRVGAPLATPIDLGLIVEGSQEVRVIGKRAGVWQDTPALRPEFRAETRRQVIKVMKRRKAEEMI